MLSLVLIVTCFKSCIRLESKPLLKKTLNAWKSYLVWQNQDKKYLGRFRSWDGAEFPRGDPSTWQLPLPQVRSTWPSPAQLPVAPRWISGSGRGQVKKNGAWSPPTQLPVAPWRLSGSGRGQVKWPMQISHPTSGGASMDIRFRPRTGKNGAWSPTTQLPVAPRRLSGSGRWQVKWHMAVPHPTSGGASMDIRFRPRTGKKGAWSQQTYT
jgi:hypothetical protein